MVGTEVSAKFKGAFCEAKIKRFSKSVKCKVLSKEPPYSTVFVDHSQIEGILEVNQIVDVTVGKDSFKAVIQHVKDNSMYTVVFNDGDERQLRRTQLCIKGAKHFDDSANLDTMPLYNPEAFSSPVVPDISKSSRYKSKR
uniref:Tudor domain-containing protein n=1 Tax=Syphacia muris TaxID=451379 RepID=A0A0N5A9M5_9BILA